MTGAFHLSIGVNSLLESVAFFTEILGATVTQDNASAGYVNLELASVQLTLQQREKTTADAPEFHFGINVGLSTFDALVRRVTEQRPECIVKQPVVVDAGSALERRKMHLRSPSGYLVEIKGMKSIVEEK